MGPTRSKTNQYEFIKQFPPQFAAYASKRAKSVGQKFAFLIGKGIHTLENTARLGARKSIPVIKKMTVVAQIFFNTVWRAAKTQAAKIGDIAKTIFAILAAKLQTQSIVKKIVALHLIDKLKKAATVFKKHFNRAKALLSTMSGEAKKLLTPTLKLAQHLINKYKAPVKATLKRIASNIAISLNQTFVKPGLGVVKKLAGKVARFVKIKSAPVVKPIQNRLVNPVMNKVVLPAYQFAKDVAKEVRRGYASV